MTIWVPCLSGQGPRYRQLAEAIEAGIRDGTLAAGDKLPPQRRLAHALGVTTGTVTHAYGEIEQRGLVDARVGSGTYVRGAVEPAFTHVSTPADDSETVDLSLSLPPPHTEREQGLRRAMTALQSDASAMRHAMEYQPEGGLAAHRACYAHWLTTLGLDMAPEELVVNQGGMNGIFLSLSVLLTAGERLAAEALSYPGLIGAAQQLGLKTVAIPFDDDGIDVEALASRHDRQPFAALYLMPEHHNPSTARLSEARRHALVALARARDFWLIEDGVLPMAAGERGTPLYRLAPERTVYLFSVAKIFGGGMRSGVMRIPDALQSRIAAALRNQSWMPPPLVASLACQWIESGDADRLLAWQQAEMAKRHALVESILAGCNYAARAGGFYVWLALPPGRRASTFTAQLESRGVVVTPAEPFCVGSEPAPQAVRICISAAADLPTLRRALVTVREVIDDPDPTLWRTL